MAKKSIPVKKRTTTKPAGRSNAKSVKKAAKKASAKKAAKKAAPKKTARKATPQKAAKKAAPKKAVKKAASKTTVKKAAPKTTVKKAAPKKAVKKTAPKKTVKKATPKKAVKKAAPKKTVKKAAPKKTVKKATPKKAVKKAAPGPSATKAAAPSAPKVKRERPTLKERFQIEFMVRSAPNVLYELISTPSGFSEWYCDDVNVKGDRYTFIWDGEEEAAFLIGHKRGEVVRFHWEDDEDPDAFFELRIRIDAMTNDVALILTDHAWPHELETARALWDSQIHNLLRVLGA